ncbi:spermatogenesis-associated protein 31H1 isoform X2 [Mus musculus]|uniref:spermatogenesis-associated protein 31H1 isoform X2 n=1 Tax=Mus musculus TaxID=10090 RepID=UPI0003D787FA|nr:uncharacterized protein C2orf16 homolog isoform X2 [Mus musculus]|eukprot:XP_006514425.1 PREDICTED: uncharacterized protein LOC102635990 isoform X2 [Mus musculus]
MESIWVPAIPLLDHLSLILLSLLFGGIWVLFSSYRSRTQVASRTEKSADSMRSITNRNLWKNYSTLSKEINLTSISGLPMGWTQDYIFSIEKSLEQIFQHLENASSALMELNFPESYDTSSSSISDTMAQESVPPCCYCENEKCSTDYSICSDSSNNSSILSYLPIFPESTTWQIQSNSAPYSPEKELSVSRNRSTPLPTFQLMDTEKSDLSQNFAVLPPLQDIPSIHLHVNIGVNSGINRTEARMSQPLTSNKQLESENDHQIIRCNPLVISMDAPSSRNVEVNAIQEEASLLKKDPKHVLKLNTEQRVTGLPEERIKSHKAQGTNVELTPKAPCPATDSIKVTPMALLQVMDLMGIIPDSHSEITDSVGETKDKTDLSQQSHQVEKVIIPPESTVASPEHQMRESKSMASKPDKITDISKVIPVALFNIVDSRGLINELCSHVIESAGIAPKSQHQVTESVGVNTLHKYQAVEPANLSLGPHHTVYNAEEWILQPQHKVTGTLNMDSGSQNQARFTPSSPQPPQIPSKVPDSSRMSPEPLENALKVNSVVQGSPMGVITETLNMDSGSQNQASSLQPPQTPSKVLDSSRMSPEPSENALKVNSVVQGSPMGVITPLQDGLTAQAKESPELPFVSQVQVRDSIGMTVHQGTENVSSTPKLPHQVMDPSEFTPWHQDLDCSEVRQSHKLKEPVGLTSDTWPQRKNPTERAPSLQITAPGAPDQETVPIGMRQQHQLTESEVVPATLKLEEVEYLGKNTTPQSQIMESVDLLPELQNINSKNLVPDPRLKGMKPVDISKDLVLIPETLVETMKIGELPTHLYASKSSDVSLNSNYSFPEPEELTEQQQASEAGVTSDTCHQVEESAELTQSSEGMTPALLSQTSESMEMSLPPLQDKPEVMVPEPQAPDVNFAHVTPEPCSEVINPLELSLPEYTESTELALPKVDDTQETIVEIYSEMGYQELNLESSVQIEESESLAEKLKCEELIPEPSVLVVEPMELTIGPTPHIIDVIPGPQLHNVKSMQIDTGFELQSELSVNLPQPLSIGVVDPEKAKPEPGLQSLSPKESVEGIQIPNVKSMDLNLDQEPPSVKSGLIPGPQLQSVRFPKLYQGLLLQGENPSNSISGPLHYSVKSDEAIPCSPMPEIRSSGFIPGSKVPEPQLQHVKSMEVNLGPCLQDVRFSDSIPKPKHHGFKYTQFIPGFPLQESTSQGFMPESFLPLSQEPQFEDRKLALATQRSEFHSMKNATQASELQRSCGISEEVNIGPWEQDTKFSELASRPKLQGVKFGEQISGLMFDSASSMISELGMHDSKLAKMTAGLQDSRHLGFNSGPWLQDVKFLDEIPGTPPQGMKTPELNSGPHLECIKIFELTTQPERQGMKPELIVQESPFQVVTGNQEPSFEDKMSYKMVPEPQVPTAETMKLATERHLANVDHSELIRSPQTQGIASSELIEGQLLGHIKPVEKNTVSKQEALTSVELTPGLHLGDIKSTKLKSKSEIEHAEYMLSTPGMHAGDRNLELPPGSSLKGLKPKLLPSKPKIEDRKSVILTVEECLKRIKSTVVSPSNSLKRDIKSVKLIPGSKIQDLKNKGLAHGTHVQDVNAMDLKLEPKKQGESPVTFVPRMLFQEKSMEVFQEPQLQGMKLKELTSQPQMQDQKPVITSCLKHQSLKPVTVAKTQGIRGVKFVDFTSTQQGCQEMAPMDLNLKSRQDDQITVKSLEWKGGIFDQQKKQLESENTLPMESDQEPKPADMTPIEIQSKLQFKDTASFELAPEPVVQSVKAKEFQNELQVPSMKPCQLIPVSQMHQEKAVESTLDPQLQGVETVALITEPQIESTKSIQWIPISEFQSEKGIGSNSKSQSQEARPTELKPPVLWRGMRSPELTARSKIQGEKSVAFHLEPQLRAQEPKTFNLTSEPQPQAITTEELNKELQTESVRSVQWLSQQEFPSVKFLRSKSWSPFQGVKWTEQKPSIKLGGEELMTRPKTEGKACDPTLRSMINNIKSFKPRFHVEDRISNELTPGIKSQVWKPIKSSPGVQKPQDMTSLLFKQESQSSEAKSGILGQGSQSPEPQWQSAKCSDLIPETKSQNMKFKLSSSLPLKSKPFTDLIMETKIQRVKLDSRPGPQSQGIKADSTLKTTPQKIEMEDCESGPQLQDLKSLRTIMGVKVLDVKSMSFSPRPHLEDMPSEVITEKNVLGMKPVEIKPSPKLQGEKPEFTPKKLFLGTQSIGLHSGLNLQDLKYPQLIMGMKLQGVDSMEQHLTNIKPSEVITQINSQGVTSVDFDSGPQTQNKKPSELFQGGKLQDMKSIEFNQGPKLQSMTVESIPETKPQCGESVKLNSGPPLQDQNNSKSTLGTNLQDARSPKINSGPHLQGVKSSEGISGDTVPKEKPMAFVYQPLGQDVESFKWIFSKALDGKPLQFKVPSELQDRKLSKLKPELYLQGMKPGAFNLGLKLEDVKANSTNPQTTKDKEINYDTDLQVVGFSELASPIYNVVPSGLKATNQKQDGKPHKLSQKQQLQTMKSTVFNHEPHLQQIKSSDLCTKLQDLKSVEFNSEQQLPDVKPSELGLGTGTQSLGFNPGPQFQELKSSAVSTEVKLLEESSSEFKHEPRLHCRKPCDWSHSKNVMAPKTEIQDVELSELHPGPYLQGIHSKEFVPGSHLEDLNSACTPNINSQYVNSSEYISRPYLQDTNSFACIPEPNAQCISSECNPGIHLHGTNSSSCFSGSKSQCVDSTGSNPESHLQDINSVECTPGPSPQCADSPAYIPGPSPQCADSPACIPGPSPQCADSPACIPGPSPQCADSPACIPGPSPQCADSSALSPEPSPPCVNSTECNPESYLQGVNSFVYTSGQNPLCENTNRYNLGPLFQGMDFCPFPSPQILCVNPVWCNTRVHFQDINSSACTLSQESESVNSIGYNSGTHLQAPKLQEQHLKYLKSELTPGSNNLGIAPMEYNTCPQSQDTNSSGFNPESKPQCISSVKPSSGPHLQSIKYFELDPGSESQSTKSVLLNSGSPSQGVDSSKFMQGAKFQKIPLLKSQLGSWQRSTEPIFTLRPQSNGVNSMILPKLPPEDRKFPEKSTQTLFCTNAVELTSSCDLNDSRSRMFSPEPCFQNVEVVQLKPASQSQSVSSSEFMSCHSSQLPMSSLAPKPCFQDTNPKQLRIGSKQESLNCQLFPSEEKPMMVLAPQSTRKLLAGPALTSVKFSNLSLKSQQQNTKSLILTSEPKWQGVKQVKLSSVSLPEPGKSVELAPKSILQNMKSRHLMPQTIDPVTKSTKVTYRPERQVDFAEMSMKPRCQVPKSVNFTSPPIYHDMGSLEKTKGLEHKSTEMMEKSVSSKPTDQVKESLEMPLKLDLQVPEFFDLTPTLSDQDSISSEPDLQKSYQIPETPESHSSSWPQFQDFKKLQIKEVTESDRVTLNVKSHVVDMIEVTCEARQEGNEFLRTTPKPVNTETGFVEKSPRPCPQDLGPLGVGSKKRTQREQSVVSTPRTSCHIPDSVSGITPGGPQIPNSKNLASTLWLQKESSELSCKQTSQVEGNTDSVELTFGTQQPGEIAAKLTKPQNLNLENANITTIESLDQMTNFVGTSPKPQDQVTEFTKASLPVSQSVALPKVSESVEVTPRVMKSVTIPESTPQKSKYNDLTPRIHDMISSGFAPSLWLQNVQSKKLIIEPTHQVLETKRRTSFRIIKTVLIPKPLVLIVKSEEVAPGPCAQAVEPIGLSTRSSIKEKECLNLHPRPHLQDLVKPMELTPRADIQVTSAEVIFQQTSPLKEPTVLIHEQRLQTEKSLGLKTESPKEMKIKDSNQELMCQNKDSEVTTSAKLQAENYLSSFIHSSSIPFLSSVDKTTELGQLQGSGVPEVSRTFGTENLGVDILQSSKPYSDTIIIKSSVLPLVLPNLPSDKTGDTKGTPYPEIWGMNILSKEESVKEKMEEFQRYSSYSFKLLSEELQEGLGARRSSIRSFLGIQQNIWESHVCRQRLPRKYLSSMLMLGNVLGTTMERKPCSQSFLTEGSTMDICQSIQNLFGVPAELMEFSQSLQERVPRTISQTSVVKNYIQRHILCHSNEKRMPLKMWTRGSTSSIIQQYSGTRLGVKKTSSKLSDILQKVTEHVSVSCSGAGFPALMKSESSLEILYTREDSVSRKQSKISPCGSPTRTFESQHSLKTSSLSQSKSDISEQSQLLKGLRLKTAGKLLKSQIPHNVPLPLESGLVLKYPICLQCGRCSGFNCCHKLQSAFGPCLLIYPQLHLLSTPEGHGEIRMHLGFRLQTGKRPRVSKYHTRNQADPRKGAASPSRRKDRFSTLVSKSPSPRNFQSSSSLSPASVQVHTQQKQRHSHSVAGKTTAKDYEFCQVHSVSESEYGSIQDERFVKSSLRKTSALTYPVKKSKEPKTLNTRLYEISTSTKDSHHRTMRGLSSRIETTQMSDVSAKRQPKKSSQSKFIQLLFHSLRQAFQAAHRTVIFTSKKLKYKMRPDNLWSIKNLPPKQKGKDHCLMEDSKGARTPVVRHMSKSLTPKQKDKLQEASECCRPAQQAKQASSLLPRPLKLQTTMVCGREVFNQATSAPEPFKRVQYVSNIATKSCSDDVSSQESKNCSNVGVKFHVQERIVSNPLLKETLQSHFGKKPINQEEEQGFFGERTLPNKPSERTHHRLLQRTHRQSLSERRHRSPSQRNSLSSSVRTYHSLSDRSHNSLYKGRGHSPSRRSPGSPSRRSPRSPSRRSPGSLSRRSPRRPSKRSPRRPSRRSPCSPSGSSHHSPSGSSLRRPSGRSPRSPSRKSHRRPSKRSPCSPSGSSHHSPSRSSLRRPSGRSPRSLSWRSPHRCSRRSPCRPLERRGHSSSVKKSLHSFSERSQQSPSSLRCLSPSKRSHVSFMRRSLGSYSERSIPSVWKEHSCRLSQYNSVPFLGLAKQVSDGWSPAVPGLTAFTSSCQSLEKLTTY